MTDISINHEKKILYNKLGSPLDFFELMKPRVMSLVIFTALVGYFCGFLSSENTINPFLSIIGIFSVALGAGSSGVINHWYDRDIDVLMDRTKKRPIPSGRVSPTDAFVFGIIGSVLSIIILGLSINWLAAFFLAFTIIFYTVIYTIYLKRYTSQNIVIGGASGSIPPIIGYICAKGNIDLEPFLLFGIIFFWTPPHFWALAIIRRKEYASANVPMLPNTTSVKNTKFQIFFYSLILVFFSTLPYWFGYNSDIYLLLAIILGFIFINKSYQCFKDKLNSEIKLFTYSIIYLFSIFLTVFFDKIYLHVFQI